MGRLKIGETTEKGTENTGRLGAGYYGIFFGLVLNLFLLVKVVPTFRDVFASFGSHLPWLTEWCIGVSDRLQFLNVNVGVFLVVGITYALLYPFYQGGWVKVEGVKPWMVVVVLGVWAIIIVAALFMPMFELGNVADTK